MLLVACVGVFGITMTSEGNRLWVMEKVEQVFGSGQTVNADNDDDRKVSDVSELEAREMIEEELGIPVPEFFYLPEGTEFIKVDIYPEAGEALMTYLYNESVLSLRIASSTEDKTQGLIYDGELVYENQLTENNIKFHISIRNENESQSMRTLIEWVYKNHNFELFGSIDEKEAEAIVKGIRY